MATTLLQQFKLQGRGDSLALIDLQLPRDNRRWSYAHLARQVERTARYLSSVGVVHGTVAALAIPNSVEFVVSFLALGALGSIASPLNFGYKNSEFTFYLEDSNAKYLIVRHDGNPIGEEVAKARGLTIIEVCISSESSEVLLWDKAIGTRPSSTTPMTQALGAVLTARPEDTCLLLHTSGTTSRPKAVPLTHDNLCASIHNIASIYELSKNDVTYLVLPLFHIHGLVCALLASLDSGGTVVIPKDGKFSASSFWTDVGMYHVTWYTAVPTIHQVLVLRAEEDYPKSNPPLLRFIRSSSAPLAPAVLQKLEATFKAPVLEGYGMTEASHQIASNPLRGVRKLGTVGQATGSEVAILNSDSNVLEAGNVGEVCIRGRSVTGGYLNNEAANQAAFVAAGGWFRTGDLGLLDSDGYLTLVGRIKELINRGGEKIHPLEVDAILLKHDAVSEAVTFGSPSAKYGEEVNSAVVLKDGATSVTPQELQAYCRTTLAEFKIPSTVFLTQSLPKTSTGKIQRRLVAEYFLHGLDK